MLDRAIGVLIVGFWLTMMTLLVQRDVVPLLTAGRPPSYKTLLQHRLRSERYRMGVWWGGRRIGSSATAIHPSGDGSYTLDNDTDLATPFPGLEHVSLSSHTRIGRAYNLLDFTTKIETGDLSGKIDALVVGDRLRIVFGVGSNRVVHEVPYDAGGTFSNGLSPFVQMPDLTVGKEWTITSVNPLTGQAESGLARVMEMEKLAWEGEEVETFRVVLTKGTQEAASWIDREGRILKEEVPFMSSKLMMIREKEE